MRKKSDNSKKQKLVNLTVISFLSLLVGFSIRSCVPETEEYYSNDIDDWSRDSQQKRQFTDSDLKVMKEALDEVLSKSGSTTHSMADEEKYTIILSIANGVIFGSLFALGASIFFLIRTQSHK